MGSANLRAPFLLVCGRPVRHRPWTPGSSGLCPLDLLLKASLISARHPFFLLPSRYSWHSRCLWEPEAWDLDKLVFLPLSELSGFVACKTDTECTTTLSQRHGRVMQACAAVVPLHHRKIGPEHFPHKNLPFCGNSQGPGQLHSIISQWLISAFLFFHF